MMANWLCATRFCRAEVGRGAKEVLTTSVKIVLQAGCAEGQSRIELAGNRRGCFAC
jgi:hypothetical protein